jgi:glycosyltransferase involved in cell wall biosynthesis
MASPFFSIILPTYNRAHLIETAVKSILTQSFSDWELILVDDGSTDNTKEVISKFSSSDKRIKYFYQENQERSIARNNGIEKSTGQFICFLDSDDYFLSTKLEHLHDFIKESTQNDSVLYDGISFLIKDNIVKTPLPTKKESETIHEFLFKNPLGSLQICAPAKVFQEFKFNPSIRIGEDVELWLRIANKFEFIPIDIFNTIALEHDDRSVNLKKYNSAKELMKQIKYIFKLHDETKISKQTRKTVLSNCMFNISKHYILNGDRLKSIFWIIKSINVDFKNVQNKHRLYCVIKLSTFQNIQEYY